MKTEQIKLEVKSHNLIPKNCTHQWKPLGNGKWQRTSKTLPGLPRCTVKH